LNHLKKKHKGASLMTVQGEWSAYIMSDAYFAKTLADDKSQVWDHLINEFSSNLLAGTSVYVMGEKGSVATSEPGLRYMAVETRFARRMLGDAVEGAIRTAMELKQERYTRVIFPTQVSANPKLAYIIMILAYPTDLEAEGGLTRGYEQYRETRANILESYCFVLLAQNKHLNTAVGIAFDAHSSQTGRRGGSEDLFAMRIDNWTDDMMARAAEAQEHYDLLREDRLAKHEVSDNEHPILEEKADERTPGSRHKPSRHRFKKPRK